MKTTIYGMDIYQNGHVSNAVKLTKKQIVPYLQKASYAYADIDAKEYNTKRVVLEIKTGSVADFDDAIEKLHALKEQYHIMYSALDLYSMLRNTKENTFIVIRTTA